ncbi:DUF2846 domain-containing protein [Bradyrhizobium sp. URHD0069]|uniref:DUF2846 domain-containing protein n=1 Tax=Bradyrhizobium sp. URHD0069 TaxID=1380355 RepID=UPI0004982E15|nr:DUF2846 domain-containing protein [Bradyrhizobium sp. URHD0069]
MGKLYRIVIAFCVAFQLAACAGTSSIESQSKQRDSRLARMYFLREQGVLGALGGAAPAAEIKIDGKAVGSVTNGSYIFVDRSPGLHKLSVQSGISLAFETEVQVEAGRAYYFNIGVPKTGAPGMDLLNQAYAGGSGQQMRAQSPMSSGFSGAVFYSLDPSAGAAAIERLKAP